MLNTPEAYRDAGLKAGTAAKRHDWACRNFHKDWFRRALALESESDRDEARRLFDEGYRDGNPAPVPCLF